MRTLLILNTGRTDVQLVDGGVRYELKRAISGELHDEIERRGYRLVDTPIPKDSKEKVTLPKGDLTLCTPKLDAVLRYFAEKALPMPTAALIFETRRTTSDDPRLAGAVLERRLKELGIPEVRRHALLTDEDRLEDPSDPRDAVVRRAVVQGVSQVLAEVFAKVRPDNVVAAPTGGFAAANAVLVELVRLHAVGNASVVEVLEVPDGAKHDQPDRAVPENFHPDAGFRARWQALSLIEKGNLLAAWGAISYLENQPGQEWTRIIDWLRRFASSLPMPDDCDIAVLKHPRMAVRAALRVELALRAEDIPRAVHGTVAFFEAALWDGLYERVERSKDPQRWRYFRIKSGEAPSGDKMLRRKRDGSDENRKRPFELMETIDGVDWYWIYDGDGGPAARLARYFLKRNSLVAFDRALGSGSSGIRALRNDVAHNEPTPKLMDEAKHKMQQAELWSDHDTFLSQPLVQNVLRELGEEQTGSLLDDLLRTIRKRLLTEGCT